MFVRSVLSSYSKLLAGLALALMAIALAGCDETVAKKAEPSRPVLVATVHYEAESPERNPRRSRSETAGGTGRG